MSRIEETFQELERKQEAALVSFITAGDPTVARTTQYASALIEGGTDIIELGIPFSDPIADGPTIQASSLRALQSHTRPQDVLRCVKELHHQHDTPIVLLSYFNPIFRVGLSSFLREARASGLDGLVVADLPFDEAAEYLAACLQEQVDPILLAAPTTSRERLNQIIHSSRGFLYLTSVTGVTGERDRLQDETLQMVGDFCRQANGILPVAVGFGISKPEHIREIHAQGADGVIIGSALVRIISQKGIRENEISNQLSDSARTFKEATKG